MKHLTLVFSLLAFLVACGTSEEEQKRLSRQERLQLAKEDSAALKIAVVPTIDCLPLLVATHCRLFDTLGVDVRLRYNHAYMDGDVMLRKKKVEGALTDIVRCEYMKSTGVPLVYATATDACWLLFANRNARIKKPNQLYDKMIAMSRYSATALLSDMVADSAHLQDDRVYRVQINDVNLRWAMMANNEMDAAWLPEPHATIARTNKHPLLADSRKTDRRMGVVAFREEIAGDKGREKQIATFLKAYDMACDSLNAHGVGHYAFLLEKYAAFHKRYHSLLPKDMRFSKSSAPRQKDIDEAVKWLEVQKTKNTKNTKK
ncbi:MAG: ABC transporter substrate-binding protein [Prevotella sp.]